MIDCCKWTPYEQICKKHCKKYKQCTYYNKYYKDQALAWVSVGLTLLFVIAYTILCIYVLIMITGR